MSERSIFDPKPYVFRSGNTIPSKGEVTLRISRLVKDWPGIWHSMSQLEAFGNGYIRHAIKYLHSSGFSDVHIVLCNGYDEVGKFDWNNDPQRDLRNKIMADYLSPAPQKGKDLNWVDYGK
jgi:hypothetical protein